MKIRKYLFRICKNARLYGKVQFRKNEDSGLSLPSGRKRNKMLILHHMEYYDANYHTALFSTAEIKVRDELKKQKAALMSTLTVRNIPADVDAAITA